VSKRFGYGNLAVAQPQAKPRQHAKRTVAVRTRTRLSMGEKLAYLGALLAVLATLVFLLDRQSQIVENNYQIQALQKQIAQTREENVALQLKIAELSSPQRVYAIAKKYGLVANDGAVRWLDRP
jgi:cell division protein FtsL